MRWEGGIYGDHPKIHGFKGRGCKKKWLVHKKMHTLYLNTAKTSVTMRLKRQGFPYYNNNTTECCNDGIKKGAKKFYQKPKTALLMF